MELGDIGMIKGVLLAWKLYSQIRTLNGEVVDHHFNHSLGVYREGSNGGEHNK